MAKKQQDLNVHWYPRYVPVDRQRARTVSEIHDLRTRGVRVQPIELRGRTIARSFWGRRWCEHLESFSEYAARLALGRTYLRNGSVCHLAIEAGGVDAMVVGSALHHVAIRIRQIDKATWTSIGIACAGQIGSALDLLEGRLPDQVTEIVTNRDAGLFPRPGEIVPDCDCSDHTTMCKHAAAALSGVGSRLDENPELLFLLRGVDQAALLACNLAAPDAQTTADAPATADIETIFAGDLDGTNGMPASDAPQPLASTPLRRVKKTLTYRPPAAIATRLPPAPTGAGDRAAGFRPTGELVASLREQCGCSVGEFADLIQVTATTVRRWETTSGPLNLHARPGEALLALHLEIEKHAR